MLCLIFFGGASSASATTQFTVTPSLPSSSAVGQTGVPASLTITNQSSATQAGETILLQTITLVPSCGSLGSVSPGSCPSAGFDPGVFRLSATGTGRAGTGCANTTFTTTAVDPSQGKYQFEPNVATRLQPTSTTGSSCVIDFTVDVLRTPSKDASIPTPGTQTAPLGFVQGTSDTTNAVGSAVGQSLSTVTRGTLTLATQVSPATMTLGGSFHDTATLTTRPGTPSPTGTVTFQVYGPDNATCAAPTTFQSINPVSGATTVSNNFTPTALGTYRVIAAYSGDANYNASLSACADPQEAVVVGAVPPEVAPPAPAPAPAPPAPASPAPAAPVTPVLSGLSLSPSKFRAAGSGPSIATRVGTTVRYTLSEAATVKFGVERAGKGRRVKGKCVKPTHSNATKKPCTRYVSLSGSFTHQGAAGPNTFKFRGRLGGRTLKPGSYHLLGVATDPAGKSSVLERINFRIVKR